MGVGPVRLPALNQRSSFFTMRYLGRKWPESGGIRRIRRKANLDFACALRLLHHLLHDLFKIQTFKPRHPRHTFETAVSGNSIMQPLPWSILAVQDCFANATLEWKASSILNTPILDLFKSLCGMCVACRYLWRPSIASPDSWEFPDSPESGSGCLNTPWNMRNLLLCRNAAVWCRALAMWAYTVRVLPKQPANLDKKPGWSLPQLRSRDINQRPARKPKQDWRKLSKHFLEETKDCYKHACTLWEPDRQKQGPQS